MFQPHLLTTDSVTLDFSSSGGGSYRDQRLVADGEVVANAIGLIDWSDDPVQVRVCEDCGITHCATGGWLAYRRIGARVLLIPAFESMAEDEEEYRPPDLIRRHGFVLLDDSAFKRMRVLVPRIPTFESLTALTRMEAAYLAQFVAPGDVLGRFPATPRLDSTRIIAVDPGEVPVQVAAFASVLSQFVDSSDPVAPASSAGVAVTFYVDMPGIPEWPAFTTNGAPSLVICREFAVRAG